MKEILETLDKTRSTFINAQVDLDKLDSLLHMTDVFCDALCSDDNLERVFEIMHEKIDEIKSDLYYKKQELDKQIHELSEKIVASEVDKKGKK